MMQQTFLFALVLHLLTVIFQPIHADVGGHDLFTSLAQLEVLWKNEMEIVPIMQEAIVKMERATKALQSYVESHQALKLDQGPNYDFLGHPVNAYHFVRHVASGWQKVQDNVIGNGTLREDLNKLKDREEEKLPDEYDVHGGAFGLVRLKSLYNYKLKPFLEKGVISTTLDNGKKVLSSPSVLKLNSYDLFHMATQACDDSLFDSCTDFYQACLNVALNETEPLDLFDYKFDLAKTENALSVAKQIHDHRLDKMGRRSHMHRCHKKPFDEKLRKKKKYKKEEDLPMILDRDTFEKLESKADKDSHTAGLIKSISEKQKDDLCRGKEIRPMEVVSKLKCFYGHGGSPWLYIAPFKIEENSLDPHHVTIHNLLFEHECDNITEFLGPRLGFPPGRMRYGSAKNDWTMKNTWPNESQNEKLQVLNKRIEHITGLNANSYKNYSEPYMCGNYGIGGHYWIHPDFHTPNPMHNIPGATGNRVATILTVLEGATAGGATVWPYAGISVFGKKGAGIFWHNLRASDIPDQFTKHSACPVLLGQKWIGNKWVGFNAQWNRRKCRKKIFDPFLPIRHFHLF